MPWDGIDRRKTSLPFPGPDRRNPIMADTNDDPRNSESRDTLDTLRRAYTAGRTIWPVVALIAACVLAYARTDYRITRLEEAQVESADRHKAHDVRAQQLLDTLHRIDLRLEAIQGQLRYGADGKRLPAGAAMGVIPPGAAASPPG